MPLKILIIDDEPALLAALRDYLDQRGFICECALEAAEAQALLAHVRFDVVLTDIYLSPLREADGLRVLSFIRERALDVRLIVMTAHATPELESEVFRLGAHTVLRKPTSLAALDDALAMVLEVVEA
jgi:DNA-binding NtrC family response regulator